MLKDGEATVNISQLARETGYSRPTIHRSMRFFSRFGKLLPVKDYSAGKGQPGRPALYRLNPAYTPKPQPDKNPDSDRVNKKRVNPSIKYPKKDKETLKNFTGSDFLYTWLDSRDDKQIPAATEPKENIEKRKLSAIVRQLAEKPLVDVICAEIWHQQHITFGTWKRVFRALWRGAGIPQSLQDNPQELAWRVRKAIKRLAAGETCETFTELLTDGAQVAGAEELERELERNCRRERGRAMLWDWYKAEVEQTGRCPYCGKETTPSAILDANFHPCSGWFFRLREELATERRRIENKLSALHERETETQEASAVPAGLMDELAGEVFKTVRLDPETELWNELRRQERAQVR